LIYKYCIEDVSQEEEKYGSDKGTGAGLFQTDFGENVDQMKLSYLVN
jgi:hypothetical protein